MFSGRDVTPNMTFRLFVISLPLVHELEGIAANQHQPADALCQAVLRACIASSATPTHENYKGGFK